MDRTNRSSKYPWTESNRFYRFDSTRSKIGRSRSVSVRSRPRLSIPARVLLLEHSLPLAQRNDFRDVNPTPLERFRHIHDPYLVEGGEFPFNYFHKLLNYGIHASKNSTTRSRIRWSADNKSLFWDGDKLIMAEWKEFVLKLLAEAENMCAV